MRKILFTIIFTILFTVPVYGNREPIGGVHEEINIIDIENFSGTLIKEEQLPKNELNKERYLGAPNIEEMCTGAIGFDNNNLRAYWDQYTDNHIYNQLSDEEKNLWNNLDDIYFEYLTTNKNFTSNTALITLNDYTYENLFDMARMYRYAHPQYFFLRPRFNAIRRIENGEVKYALTIEFYDKFKNGNYRLSESIKIKDKLEEWGKQLQKCRSDHDKIKLAHDIICNKVSYDSVVTQDDYDWAIDPNISQSMYSVICRDKTVCAGYAITFSCLCNYTGVTNTVVSGSGHAWDMVAINDNWYNIDVCWDDGDEPYYKNFLVSDQYLYSRDGYHFKYDFWKPYISIAERNYNGTEEFEGDIWYYDTYWWTFGSNQIKYNLGNVIFDNVRYCQNLPTYYYAGVNTYITINDISRIGYKFNGWYYNGKKVTKLTKKELNGNDISLYANWTPIKYKIQFYKGVFTKKEKAKIKGTTKAIKNIKYDEAVNLTECGYKYPGYKFIGWTTVKLGTIPQYLNAERVSNLSKDGTTVKLYAVWKKE